MSTAQQQGSLLLQNRDFLFFLGARSFSSVAIRMLAVAVGWQIYETTRSPLDLGWVGLSQFLPFIVLVLPAGHAADRLDRRRISALCMAVQILCVLALLVLTVRGLVAVWPVFAVMALFGVSRAFYIPAMQALVPGLVPSADLNRAVGLNVTVSQLSTVIGPVLGGVLYLWGPTAVYATSACLLLIAASMLMGIRARSKIATSNEPTTWHTLLAGLRFVKSKSIILGALTLDLFAVLFGGVTALLPIYASDILHVGPGGLGLLRAAPGVGASLCALALAVLPISRFVGRWILSSVAIFGLATVVFGLTTHFLVALIALTVIGASDMVSVYVRNLLVQLETPDEIRGRVNAVSAVMIGASNELGEFESGVLASWCGAVRAVVIGGVATLTIVGLWTRLFPALGKMDRFSPSAN
ncbi:MAG: MFS transporter [Candidatus Obscuribacterales bacterium]|nr:MFS transporter [Steroidobacteraceae bacterium]